jgi:hypothetical protein
MQAEGAHATLKPIERVWVYMPFMHSEVLEDQQVLMQKPGWAGLSAGPGATGSSLCGAECWWGEIAAVVTALCGWGITVTQQNQRLFNQ